MKPTSTLLIDVLEGLIAEADAIDDDLVTEAAVARAVGTTTARLRRLRAAGLVAAERVGRGYIYRRAEARTAAATAALVALGADTSEVAALLARDYSGRAEAVEVVAALLGRISERVRRDLARARAFQDLLTRHGVGDIGSCSLPEVSDAA